MRVKPLRHLSMGLKYIALVQKKKILYYRVHMKRFLKKRSWGEVLKQNLQNYVVLLDIDGVLMADGENTISDEIRGFVIQLKENNDVYLVSNSPHKARCHHSSSTLEIPWVDSPHKKPSTRILKYIDYDKAKPLIVIGDKILTDGIFAKRIGAEMLMMERRVNEKDNFFIKLTYIIDDAFFSFLKFL